MTSARITIICVGAADPDLLTISAQRALRESSCVVVDAEVRALVDAVAPEHVECIEVAPSLSRAQRTRLLSSAVKRHGSVVRVIGGDPVLDGVLSQEMQACGALARVTVIPGVARIGAAAAYSGMSLTSGRTREVVILDGSDPDVDWSTCVEPRTTLVILHAADAALAILRQLVAAGRAPETPFRIVRNMGTVEQTTVSGEIGSAQTAIRASAASGDGILMVGDALRVATDWFEQQPLFGWRILVPRTKDSVDELLQRIAGEGATSTEVATVSVEPPRTPQQMTRALAALVEGGYGWAVFTSANSFQAVWDRCREVGLDARAFAGTRIAAVGDDTAEAMALRGLTPDLGPLSTTAELVAEFVEPSTDAVARILVPRAEIATETLAAGLVELGWEVDEVTAFRTVRSAPPSQDVRDDIKSGGFDAAIFTSAATVRNLIGLAGKPHARTVIACIGAQTARTAEEYGLRVDCIADETTHDSLVDALVQHAAALQGEAQRAGTSVWRPSIVGALSRRRAK